MMFFRTVLSIALLFCNAVAPAQKQRRPPNVILIFLDDMGNGDLTLTGATDYATPNIDRLASEGLRLTNFLTAQAVCSASRAGLLTGCYPNRIGIAGALGPTSTTALHADEITLAELCKSKGYQTGIFGKWHLGHKQPFLPLQHGFDEFFGLPYSNDMWPVDYDGAPSNGWKKERYPPLYLIDGNETAEAVATLDDQALLTGKYTRRAVQFIEKNKQKPFFLYLPHSMPHVPLAASAAFAGKSRQGAFGDVMMEIDWSVGEVMKAVKDNKLEENTIVIFTSDNGPWLNFGNHAGSTGGLREGKGTSFEGGQRVPCLIRWKGVIQPGSISNSLTSTIDIFPTVGAVLGAAMPDHKIDGISFLPIINGDLQATPRKYFYYYYRRNNLEAVRMENWKLILPHFGRSYEGADPGRDGHPGKVDENNPVPMALYDLRRDPGERYDVQHQHPDVVQQLKDVAEAARKDLGDDITQRTGEAVRQPATVTP